MDKQQAKASELPKSKRFVDLSNKVFGRLLVMGYAGKINNRSYWACKCECGVEKSIKATHLTGGLIVSCGCYNYEKSFNFSHGHKRVGHKSSTYNSWSGMKSRCYNVNDRFYDDYGGRGITVCDRWRSNFSAFLEDMGERPEGTTIDRHPDNDGNYCPENCRWATPSEQANNRRSNTLLVIGGVEKTMAQWAIEFGLSPLSISRRINRLGWSAEKAITTPILSRTPNGWTASKSQ